MIHMKQTPFNGDLLKACILICCVETEPVVCFYSYLYKWTKCSSKNHDKLCNSWVWHSGSVQEPIDIYDTKPLDDVLAENLLQCGVSY